MYSARRARFRAGRKPVLRVNLQAIEERQNCNHATRRETTLPPERQAVTVEQRQWR
jgi:hypothetical protein